MIPRYERFNDLGRRVMFRADIAARELRHEYIGVEHILLGLTIQDAGRATSILHNLGVTSRWLLRVLKPRLTAHQGPYLDPAQPPPLTPRAVQALDCALEESQLANSDAVGTEHILLGLLRDHAGLAAETFRLVGLTLEEVRNELDKPLDSSSASTDGP